MSILGRTYSRSDLFLILAHAALCLVVYVAIAATLDDQMLVLVIMIPFALLTSLIGRRRLWG
jgi:hypothetical protein